MFGYLAARSCLIPMVFEEPSSLIRFYFMRGPCFFLTYLENGIYVAVVRPAATTKDC